MSKAERVYRRTDAGLKAWEAQDPSLSAADRQILGLIDAGAHWHELRKRLTSLSEHQSLANLEARGLVLSEAAEAEADLDFTGSFAFGKR